MLCAGVRGHAAVLPHTQHDPRHQSRDGGCGDHLGEDAHVVLDNVPVRAQRIARVDEDCVPDERSGRRQERESRQIHARHSGGQRDEGAKDGNHAPEEDSPRAVPVEEGLGPDDVGGIDERQRVEDLAGAFAAEQCTERVESERSHQGPGRAPRNGAKQSESRARACGETGEGKDDLRRQRRKEVLQRDEGRCTRATEGVDNADGPAGNTPQFGDSVGCGLNGHCGGVACKERGEGGFGIKRCRKQDLLLCYTRIPVALQGPPGFSDGRRMVDRSRRSAVPPSLLEPVFQLLP